MEGYAPPNGANHQDAGTSWTGLPPPPPPPPFAPQPQQQQQPLAGPSHLPPHPHGYHPDYHPQQPPPPPSLISPESSSNGVGVSPASTAADTPNSTGGARGGVGGAATGKGAKGKGKKRAGSVDGAEKVDKDGNAKKKRKQLVACDSCRLRRVKCDKAEKEEGKDCTECEKKSITCTDTYVKNKPKVVRGGKLIAQAKALYGNKPEGENGGPAPNGAPSSSAGPSSRHNSIDELRRASAGSVGPVNPSEGRLMSADVGHEISEHLIRTYFDHLHPQCPLVDEESFMAMFEAAGKRAEGMTPANECLCLVIQAWAARFSSHLLIAGPGAPALSELRTAGRDFTMLGNRRDEFALAMRDRALAACDRHGLLRTSSAAACAALTLLEFLVTWNDPHRSSTCGRYLLTTAIEHLRHLQLGKCDDPTEEVLPPERVSNGTLLWMCYTRDALASLLGGRSLSLTEDDLALFCDLFVSQLTANAEPYVTSSDARMLSGLAVAAIFRFGVGSIRTTVGRLTSPLARRSQVEEQTLRDIWASVDELTRLQSLFRASVDTASFGPEAPKTDVWFRDLVAIKSQHQLGIHANLTSRLEEEEGRTETTDGGAYGELLTRLKGESEARMLDVSREYAGMLHSYGSELMYSAAFSVEYPASYLTCMVEVPALEQGGGNEGWTWVQKVEEISSFLEALKLVGWAWPRFDQLIGNARNSLAEQSSRLQHQHQALVAKQGSYPTPDYDAPHPQHLYHDSAVSQQQQDWRSASFSGPPVNGVVGHYAQPQPQPQAHLPMLPPSRPQSSAYAYTPASEAYSETSTSYTSYSQPALPSHLSQQSSVTPPPHLSGHSQPQHQHQQPPSNSFFDYSLQPSGALPPGGEDGLAHDGGQQHRGSV